MNLSFYIAKRYLIAKKTHNAINIISWISVISVGIGTFALVVVLSAFNGLEGLVESLFESFDSDIRIEAKNTKVFPKEAIPIENIGSIEGVEDYTFVLEEICGVRYKKQQVVATIKGIEESFLSMSNLDSSIIDGELILKEYDIPYAISGYGIASQLGLYLSKSPENLSIYAPKRQKISTINPLSSVYRKMIAPGAVFYISPEYDNKYIIVPISFAQQLLDYDEETISSVEIKVEEDANIQEVKEQIAKLMDTDEYTIRSRYEFNEIIYKTNKTEKWVTFLILLFILTLAAFNILSSLSMLIIEKKKDIYTLKSMGAKKQLIRSIFFTEGMLINLGGALTGLILGVLVCVLQQYVGLVRLEGGIVEFYPVIIRPIELFYILITVLVIGFLTSWYPVRNLTKLA